jgi:hypothetical protein
MKAKIAAADLCGRHIGRDFVFHDHSGRKRYGVILMVTHRKDHGVKVRWLEAGAPFPGTDWAFQPGAKVEVTV